MKTLCLKVWGDYACFTRPEMKVERVSYDVITPSAARAVFEAILWKPAIRWHVTKVEVLRPIRWISVRRNEVGSVASTRNAQTAVEAEKGNLGIYIEEKRQQRAGLFLRDVGYRLHARFEMRDPTAHKLNYPKLVGQDDPEESAFKREPDLPVKYLSMFERRAQKGQCIMQPYLGCREFSAHFQWVPDPVQAAREEPPNAETRDLGWMLYDIDYANGMAPQFFRAQMKEGLIDLTDVEVRG